MGPRIGAQAEDRRGVRRASPILFTVAENLPAAIATMLADGRASS